MSRKYQRLLPKPNQIPSKQSWLVTRPLNRIAAHAVSTRRGPTRTAIRSQATWAEIKTAIRIWASVVELAHGQRQVPVHDTANELNCDPVIMNRNLFDAWSQVSERRREQIVLADATIVTGHNSRMIDDEDIAKRNPYSPPKGRASSPLPPLVGSFTVGSEQRVVEIFLSYWSGLEIYTVDGVEVLRTRNYQLRGVREFDVGEHQVVIKVDFWPSWRILLRPWDWVAEAYIDGELAVEDVTPETRARLRSLVVSPRYVLLFLLVLLGVAITVVLLLFMSIVLFGTVIRLGLG